MSEGGQLLLLEAEADPGLALLIPGDNYSSAIVRGVPGGLAEVGSTAVNTAFPLSTACNPRYVMQYLPELSIGVRKVRRRP